jgi:thiol-disulfide isomerase/thioredoxin
MVRWPSGRKTSVSDVPEGTLLTAYENPANSPSGEAFTHTAYRIKPAAQPTMAAARPIFRVAEDTAAKPARLRVYTTFATWCPSCKKQLPTLRRLKDELWPEGVDLVALPIDPEDDNEKLAAYAKEWKPTSRLVNIPQTKRVDLATAFSKALGEEPPLPSTIVTDQSGRVLSAQPGVPSISELRKMLVPNP